MSITAVLFDIGGVVVKCDLEQYAPIAAQVFESDENNVRAEVQSRVPLLETGKMEADAFWLAVGKSLQDKGVGKLPLPGKYRGLWTRILKANLKLDTNLLKICWQLKGKGLTVGALSNTIEEHADHLEQVGAYQAFKPCVLSFVVGQRKPDMAIYRTAAKQAAASIQKCLLIDDNTENIVAARQAGMQGYVYRDLPGLLLELNRLKLL